MATSSRHFVRSSAICFRQFLHNLLGNQVGVSANKLTRLRYLTSKYVTSNIRSASQLRIGTFVGGSLAIGSFWSTPAKEEPKAPEPTQEELAVAEADHLYTTFDFIKVYEFLIQFKDSRNDELLWRLSRACRDVAMMSTTTAEKKKQLTYDSLKYAKESAEINDKNWAAHKWIGICISDVGDIEGTKQKITNSYIVKEEVLKAIELNPNDPTSKHILGIWCYNVADLPWYQQKIAEAIFGTLPKTSFEEALKWFEDAENTEPNFYSKNLLFLGKTYLKINNRHMALLYLTKARDYQANTEEDHQVKEEAKQLLAKIAQK